MSKISCQTPLNKFSAIRRYKQVCIYMCFLLSLILERTVSVLNNKNRNPRFLEATAIAHRLNHRLNMELDLQSLFGLHVHSCTHWLRPRNPLPPPAFGLIYEGAIGQPIQTTYCILVSTWIKSTNYGRRRYRSS
jgi:hypothetical protein